MRLLEPTFFPVHVIRSMLFQCMVTPQSPLLFRDSPPCVGPIALLNLLAAVAPFSLLAVVTLLSLLATVGPLSLLAAVVLLQALC